MLSRTAAKLAFAAAIIAAPLAQAHAYSIHVVDGVYTIECANGVKSTGTTLQVSHAQAAYFCKVRGSSISTGGSGGASDGAGVKAGHNRAVAR